MLRVVAAVLAVLFLCVAPAAAAQEAPALLTAQQIALFADRGLLVAGGGMALHSAAFTLTATRAAYDLRTNRLTAAGSVTVTIGGRTERGSGYVYDFTAKRGAFVPGAQVPQLDVSEALVTGSQAELQPAASIAFSNAQVRSGTAFVPQAAYRYTIPSPHAKDFGYSPVPSAALEWPVLLASGRDAYAFARARFDKYNGGPGAGLEEHYARTDRGYAALGETMDADGARYDLAAYQRLSGALSQTLTAERAIGADAFRYALSSSGSGGYASLSFSQYGASRSDDLLASGNQRSIGSAGSVRAQIDLGHDVRAYGTGRAQDWRVTPALHADTATLHLRSASFSASFDVGETVYTFGRGTLASSASLWGNVPVTQRLFLNASLAFSHAAPPFPSTYRTYLFGAAWRASRAFNLVTSLTYAHDFGQAFGRGRPLFAASFDVRVLRRNGSGVEVGALVPFGGLGDMTHQAGLNLRFIRR